MRITSEVMVARSLDRLQTRLSRYERAQSELATGSKILAPSDDPSGSRRASSLTSAMRAREQELRNAADATGWIDTADSQLQSVLDRLSRARELATRAASDTGPGERTAIAAEIRAITEEIAGIANASHVDRPLFGGFSAGPAVARDGGGAWITQGDGDQVTRRVSDSELVRVNVTAQEFLGFGSPQGDVLTQLDDLAADIEAGIAVGGRLDDLRRGSEGVADSLAVLGAASNRVQSAEARATDLLLTLRTELSRVQDVDMAEGIMELQVQQVAYEATLSALSKALPPTLVSFLR